MLITENQLHFLYPSLCIPLFSLRGMGKEKSTEEELNGRKLLDGPCFLPWYTIGSCKSAAAGPPWSKPSRRAAFGQCSLQKARRSQCRRCGRKMGVIRALQCASYSWRQNSPSGAIAGERSKDSPPTTLTRVTGIPRNIKPSSHVLSCRAAQAKDTASLLLSFSEHLHFAEHTSPKVPGIFT